MCTSDARVSRVYARDEFPYIAVRLERKSVSYCACVRVFACARARVRVCVCVCIWCAHANKHNRSSSSRLLVADALLFISRKYQTAAPVVDARATQLFVARRLTTVFRIGRNTRNDGRYCHNGSPTAATTAVLLAVEQPSEHSDFRVRQPLGERFAGGLRSGRRGTMHERAQSRLVRLQSLFRDAVKSTL